MVQVSSESMGRGNGQLHELAPLKELSVDEATATKRINNHVTIATDQENCCKPRENRAEWSGKMQFFLSIIGYSIGLGNVWRFPYYCQQNGGGAFLIPFFVMVILEGIPLFLLELGLGQKMRQGVYGVWNTLHPWLGGIGIASCVVAFFVALYYNVIIAWCLFYLYNSLQAVTFNIGKDLPWASCPLNENSQPIEECSKTSETAYFWYRVTLDASSSIQNSDGFKWWIVVSLLVAWILVFFIVMKGIQSSGKVVYFTSIFPYIVLTIFLVRGLTLKGASDGLAHLYTPKWRKLLEPTVWLEAATQVFFSFGLSFGTLVAFGSYNNPRNNCVRDVLLVSTCNVFTAIYASIVVFSILGFKAMLNYDKCLEGNHQLLESSTLGVSQSSRTSNQTWAECSLSKELDSAAQGTGLAFIVFTQAIVELPGAPLWSCLFFFMLLALGLGSQIGFLEGMLCVVFDIDLFKRFKKQYITGVVCSTCFAAGLIFCTGAGEYWLEMFDNFAGTLGLVVIGFMEMFAVMFVYGHKRFSADIEEMTGIKPGWYWQVTWRFLAPVILLTILISSTVSMFLKNPTYSAWNAIQGTTEAKNYPDWVLAIGVVIVLLGIMPIPVVFLLRRFQCIKLDMDIHQGSIRRIDTTVSTKEMIGDVDLDEYQDRMEDFSGVKNIDSDDSYSNSSPPVTIKSKKYGRETKSTCKKETINF